MNYAEFKSYIKEEAEKIRCIDNIPKDLSPEKKIIVIEARQELYLVLSHLLENADKERSALKGKKDKFWWLPE